MPDLIVNNNDDRDLALDELPVVLPFDSGFLSLRALGELLEDWVILEIQAGLPNVCY